MPMKAFPKCAFPKQRAKIPFGAFCQKRRQEEEVPPSQEKEEEYVDVEKEEVELSQE